MCWYVICKFDLLLPRVSWNSQWEYISNQNVINCALHSEPRCGEEAMKNIIPSLAIKKLSLCLVSDAGSLL